ncbi:MAG: apolipoprotein N-acyltransferase [Bacteroidia bacterium]
MPTTAHIHLWVRWYSWWQALPTKRPYRAALLAGFLLGLAFPPFSLAFLGWLAFPLFWRLAEAAKPLRVLYSGLLLWNLIGCYWLMLTALSAPDWQEALLSLGAGAAAIVANPLLMLLPFWLTRRLSGLLGQPFSPWLFIGAWGLFEYLHFRWELSWSWLTLGFAWSEWFPLRALGQWIGPLGISVWMLIGAAWLYQPKGWLRWAGFAVWSVGLPLGALIFPPASQAGRARSVYAIQPNIDPYTKFAEFPPDSQVQYLIRLLPAQPEPGALIVFPETAIPIAVPLDGWKSHPYLLPFTEYARRYQVNVLLGIVGYRFFPPGGIFPVSAHPLPEGGAYETYNAALLLRPDTYFVHIKARLVPFVERVPYLEVFSFLRRWYIDLGGSFGNFGKPQALGLLRLFPDEMPLVVGICYESIFLQDLRQRLKEGPALLAFLTNDGWWKKSSGYYQHFTYGRLSAQVLGLPAVRSANTGISALIAEGGRVEAALPYGEAGRLEGVLWPQKPLEGYAYLGEIGWGLLVTFALSLWLRSLFPWRPSSKSSAR